MKVLYSGNKEKKYIGECYQCKAIVEVKECDFLYEHREAKVYVCELCFDNKFPMRARFYCYENGSDKANTILNKLNKTIETNEISKLINKYGQRKGTLCYAINKYVPTREIFSEKKHSRKVSFGDNYTLAEMNERIAKPVLDHNLSPVSALQILSFFGYLADIGFEPKRVIEVLIDYEL